MKYRCYVKSILVRMPFQELDLLMSSFNLPAFKGPLCVNGFLLMDYVNRCICAVMANVNGSSRCLEAIFCDTSSTLFSDIKS